MVGLPFVHPRKAHRRSPPRSNASRLTVSEYNARHYAATYLFGEIQRQRGGRSAPLNPDHGKPHSRERTTNRDNAPAVFPLPFFWPNLRSVHYPFQRLIDPDRRISPSPPSLDFCATAYTALSPYTECISDTSNLIARFSPDSCPNTNGKNK